ncbi:MAG: hypothetical protein E3I13_03475 [Gammaproteobacteria bacterium]|nr:MAG: hypothetical protein E3I13_03475 [Gammaproteobacteria bacterium]
MLAHTKQNFETYPTNRVVAIVDSKMEADEVCCELMDAGFDGADIDEAVGKEGLKFLDPDGRNHGLMTKLIRKWQFVAQGEELKYLNRIKKGLEEGHTVMSVPALTESARGKVAKILRSHHAEGIRYYGRFYVENLDNSAV